MTLCGGVIEREALCRVRADGVRVRWGAFCVPGCLCAWLPAYLMSTLLRGGLLRSGLVCLGDGVKNLFFRALVGIFMAFEFCVIYISVKYLIPFYSGNYCGIKF